MAKDKRADMFTSAGERYSYLLYYFGVLISYSLFTGFLNLFLTDIGIPAAIVGTMLVCTRIWDAVNDPIFGVIVDKTSFKGGKYIPWVRIASFMIPIATILMFSIPSSLSLVTKVVLAVLAYLLWDVAYTVSDIPIYALPTAMTSNIKERDGLYVNSKFTAFVGIILAGAIFPMLYPEIGWSMAVIILSVFSLITMIPVGFKARERFYTDQQSPSFMELVRSIIRNKYLFVYHGALVIFTLANLATPVQAYFAIHCLGGPEYLTAMALIASLPTLLMVFIAKWLLRKVDKLFLGIASIMGMSLTGVLLFFVGYSNLTVLFVLLTVRALFFAMHVILTAMFTADCAEYGNFKTGERLQGTSFAIQAFTTKFNGAISVAICMFILGIFGFKEGADAVQSEAVVSVIWNMYSWVPVITGVLASLLLAFGYKLRQKDVAVMVRANKGEITHEEATALMSRSY